MPTVWAIGFFLKPFALFLSQGHRAKIKTERKKEK